MNIAFLVVKHIIRGGGIERYTLELGSRLVDRGHNVTVYSMRHYGQVPTEYKGMRIISVPSFAAYSMQKLSCSAVAAVRASFNQEFDILHFHSLAPAAFAWIPKLRGHKCVLQMHGLEWKRTRWGNFGSLFVRFLEKLALPQVHAYTAVSQTQCDYFLQHYGIKMEYIPTAADIKPKIEANEIYRLGLEPGRYILFVCRLVKEKGAHYLIPAFRQLNTEMKLVIAGDVQGGQKYKRKLFELANGDHRILFPGFAEGRLLEELFGHCYICVQPSDVEGLSLSILEAMSYGRCCLVSDIPENLEAIGDCGFRFPSSDIDSLQERLDWLLGHPQQVEAMGICAKERVRLQYSWQSVTDQMEDFYLNVLQKEARTPRLLFGSESYFKKAMFCGKLRSDEKVYAAKISSERVESSDIRTLPPKSIMLNAFSVDAEDWFHILNTPSTPPIQQWDGLESRLEPNMEKILEILDESDIRATFFWLGWLAERHRSLVRKCHRQGHEIASHSYAHVLPWEVGPQRFKDDIVRAKKVLEDIVGGKVAGFRTAGFGITKRAKWAFDVIAEAGYKYDSSVTPSFWEPFGKTTCQKSIRTIVTSNGPLIEVPVSAFRLFGLRIGLFGGGYLRLLPKWALWLGIQQLRGVGCPLIAYIHPREIDPEHPRLTLGPLRRFRCYINVKRTLPKLQWLCKNYDFVPIRELVNAFCDG